MWSDIGMCGKSTVPSGNSGTSMAITRWSAPASAPPYAALQFLVCLMIRSRRGSPGRRLCRKAISTPISFCRMKLLQIGQRTCVRMSRCDATPLDSLIVFAMVCSGSLRDGLIRLYAASGYDSAPMPHHLGTLRPGLAGTIAGAAMAVLALAACGSAVPVSSQITPVPPDCSTARPASALDSFASAAALQSGPSGLQFADLRVGCGAVAAATANVNVQFTVWLSTGTQVITTRGPNQPTNAL